MKDFELAKMNETEIREDLTTKKANEQYANIISFLGRVTDEIIREQRMFNEALYPNDKAQVLNQTIHHITSNLFNGNIRIDLLADVQAEFTAM